MSSSNKFSEGDKVSVRIERKPMAWKWEGIVETVRDAGWDDHTAWEYEVSNAPRLLGTEFPLLAWEDEMTLITKAYEVSN